MSVSASTASDSSIEQSWLQTACLGTSGPDLGRGEAVLMTAGGFALLPALSPVILSAEACSIDTCTRCILSRALTPHSKSLAVRGCGNQWVVHGCGDHCDVSSASGAKRPPTVPAVPALSVATRRPAVLFHLFGRRAVTAVNPN